MYYHNCALLLTPCFLPATRCPCNMVYLSLPRLVCLVMYLIRKCLSLNAIPHGFNKSSNLTISSPRMQASSERASFTYSQCLMRNTRIDFTQRFNVVACSFEDCKMYFTSTIDLNSLVECPKSYVLTLNQVLLCFDEGHQIAKTP